MTLQEKMNEIYWYLVSERECITLNKPNDLFEVVSESDVDGDQPHGLGKFKSKGVAEACRLALIGTLVHYQKIENGEEHTRNYIDERVGKQFLAEK